MSAIEGGRRAPGRGISPMTSAGPEGTVRGWLSAFRKLAGTWRRAFTALARSDSADHREVAT